MLRTKPTATVPARAFGVLLAHKEVRALALCEDKVAFASALRRAAIHSHQPTVLVLPRPLPAPTRTPETMVWPQARQCGQQ